MKITLEILMVATGCSAAVGGAWLLPLQVAMDGNGIVRERSVAAFLANVGVETGSLKLVEESLNYSATGMANTWPSRYAVVGPGGKYVKDKSGSNTPNALAISLEKKPQAIANNVYANRMGNGPESSGDGWKYRGRGLIQTTGKSNYEAYKKRTGVDVLSYPDKLKEPGHAAESAAFWFASNGCVEIAETGDFSAVVKRVNGKEPCEANHGDLRRSRYAAALALLYKL